MDPWSKGDYSQLIREASMVVEKLPVMVLPSGRVPGRVLLVPRSWKRGGGGTEMRSRKRVPSSRVSGRVQYICQMGSPEAEVGPQAPPWSGQGWGRAGWPPGPPQAPLWPCLGFSGSSRYADFSCIFPGIFRALLIWGKPEIEKQQKTGTGTVVH